MLRPAILLSILASFAAHAAEVKIGTHTFTVPDGFELDVVAGPPLVERPITMAFDESGALYVAESSGSNEKVQKQLEDKPHRILRLVDRDRDGRFDERSVFVDRIMFPEGTMWLDGALYVSAPPQIWKFTDKNGDGVAEQQDVWFDGKTLTNCANDLHGPYAGPDGYIYWCKGAFAEQQHQLADGRKLTTTASHIFRARPDGSGLESVMAGGMDNPVDVVFTASGERLLSGTFFVHPSGGQRDGILHAVYGGLWGKDHAVIDGHRRTGDLMPVMTHLGPAAPSGLELRRAANWGPDWQGNLFACHFNLRKVSRHVLEKSGATFATADSDLVVSDQADFHPTDVVESPDGDLLIADTGGWYKLCCPTSQLHKPDVLGAIYRLRKTGARRLDPVETFDWANAAPSELAPLLADPRPAVADRAMAALAKAGESAVTALASCINTPRPGASTSPVSSRLNAIWTLTRISGDSARATVRFAFADGDPGVRTAAAISAGLWRDAGATEALINQLRHADLHLRRAAMEALGRIGDKNAAAPIIAALANTNDRFLEHSCAYALMELRAVDAAREALQTTRAGTLRASLAALHDLQALRPEELLAQLASSDPATQRLAQWIAGRHPDWSPTLSAWISDRVQIAKPADAANLRELLARLASSNAMQAVIARLSEEAANAAGPVTNLRRRKIEILFGAIQDSGLKELPEAWRAPLIAALRRRDETSDLAIAAIRPFARRGKLPADLTDALIAVTNDHAAEKALRLGAFSVIPGKNRSASPEVFSLLISELRSGDLLRGREAAAELGRCSLDEAQLTTVAAELTKAADHLVAPLIEVFHNRRGEANGKILLDAIAKLKAPPAATVRSVILQYPGSIKAAAESLLALNTPPAAATRLGELLAELPKGDIRRGHLLFQSPRSACSTCHAMAYTGGSMGPDLTRIGATRTERDLLEAIVYPSLSFVRSYEPVLVKTSNGAEHLGIVKKEDAGEVVLATGPQTEARLSRSDVQSMKPSPISLMPQGYDGIFSPQELADLVAFLKAAR